MTRTGDELVFAPLGGVGEIGMNLGVYGLGEHRKIWEPGKVDMVFFRENTEGLYSGIGGFNANRSVAIDTRVITRASSERIIRRAFELSRKRKGAPKDGKKRVTCIA